MNENPAKLALLVDDEPPVREYVRAILEREGFAVMEAGDGLEALELIQKAGCTMQLVVTDIKMPRLDGITMAEKVRGLCPGVPVLLISGWAYPFQAAASGADFKVLRKPFLPAALRDAVRSLVAA